MKGSVTNQIKAVNIEENIVIIFVLWGSGMICFVLQEYKILMKYLFKLVRTKS